MDIDQLTVANPVRPETTTTETDPLENEGDGEASNNEADTANADNDNSLDNEVEEDATDGLEQPDRANPETQEATVAGDATVTRKKKKKWSLKPWSLKP